MGDQCTSFFFKSVSNLTNRIKITSLTLEDGTLTQDITTIKSTFTNFYTNLLGTPHPSAYSGYSRIQLLVFRKLSDAQSLNIVSEVSNQDIKDTFWSLNPQKAPRPDSYNVSFFRRAWPIIGHEVTAAVKLSYRFGQLLKKTNSTPKIPNPSKVGDYKPISCRNSIYKCIAKILANRLQIALPFLIDPVQSGFVKGRRIADNIFLTQEIMRGYHKHFPSPKCAMKVDIMKAHDSVRWEFLWDV